jgi:tRNA A37 N6-isopentenylltransferase MiaA
VNNHYEIQGNTTIIAIRQKRRKTIETLISTEDLPKVQLLSAIYTKWDKSIGNYYAQGYSKEIGTVNLHRYLIDAPPDKFVDHINRNILDNRRHNLRLLTPAESNQNQGLRRDNNSGYRGVSWEKNCKKWRVVIQVNGKQRHFGLFNSLEEAAMVAANTRKQLLPYAEG